jgi:membrane protein implicated in regulation of membrane protease activity
LKKFPSFIALRPGLHKVQNTVPFFLTSLDSGELLAIAVAITVVAAILGWYLWSIKWALFRKPFTGPESLIGKTGAVVAPFERGTMGEVNIDGIIWKAKLLEDVESHNSKLLAGESVVVVGYAALTVIVRKS